MFKFNTEQNEAKHDSSSSPGMTDQEKEMAASAYEAFLVNIFLLFTLCGFYLVKQIVARYINR